MTQFLQRFDHAAEGGGRGLFDLAHALAAVIQQLADAGSDMLGTDGIEGGQGTAGQQGIGGIHAVIVRRRICT